MTHPTHPATVVLALLAGTIIASAQSSSSLPGGASSLQETYEDWRVACQSQQASHICALSQTQAQANGQRIMSIDMTAGADGETAKGNLVLPFGLKLDAGVGLQVEEGENGSGSDAGEMGEPLPFLTCLPAGCVVPVEFDAGMVEALRKGKALLLHAKSSGDDKPAEFRVSLKGFATALDRTAKLAPTN